MTKNAQSRSAAQTHEEVDSRMSDHVRAFLIIFMLGNVIWIIIVSASVTTWNDFFRLSGTCGLLSGASLISGALFGFIFGIPRSLTSAGTSVFVSSQSPSNMPETPHVLAHIPDQKSADQTIVDKQPGGEASANHDPKSPALQSAIRQPIASSRPAPTVAPNTNLEQISDWLTKVLVGIGLSQIEKLPNAFNGIESKLGPVLLPIANGGVIGISICTAFSVAGFCWAYFESRTSLMALFGEII
jgi:hypothetical protein